MTRHARMFALTLALLLPWAPAGARAQAARGEAPPTRTLRPVSRDAMARALQLSASDVSAIDLIVAVRQEHGLGGTHAAHVLRQMGYTEEEVGGALFEAYLVDADMVAYFLLEAGYSAAETAYALRRSGYAAERRARRARERRRDRLSAERRQQAEEAYWDRMDPLGLLDPMRRAGYSPAALNEWLREGAERSAEEALADLQAADMATREMLRQWIATYRLTMDEAAAALIGAQVAAEDVAEFLFDELDATVRDVAHALYDASVDVLEIAEALQIDASFSEMAEWVIEDIGQDGTHLVADMATSVFEVTALTVALVVSDVGVRTEQAVQILAQMADVEGLSAGSTDWVKAIVQPLLVVGYDGARVAQETVEGTAATVATVADALLELGAASVAEIADWLMDVFTPEELAAWLLAQGVDGAESAGLVYESFREWGQSQAEALSETISLAMQQSAEVTQTIIGLIGGGHGSRGDVTEAAADAQVSPADVWSALEEVGASVGESVGWMADAFGWTVQSALSELDAIGVEAEEAVAAVYEEFESSVTSNVASVKAFVEAVHARGAELVVEAIGLLEEGGNLAAVQAVAWMSELNASAAEISLVALDVYDESLTSTIMYLRGLEFEVTQVAEGLDEAMAGLGLGIPEVRHADIAEGLKATLYTPNQVAEGLADGLDLAVEEVVVAMNQASFLAQEIVMAVSAVMMVPINALWDLLNDLGIT